MKNSKKNVLSVLVGGVVMCASPVVLSAIVDTGAISPMHNGSDPWNVGGDLSVGKDDNGAIDESGTLEINGGSSVTNVTGRIGHNDGDDGTVTVTGTGSTWTNTESLLVGRQGNGTLNILLGGQVSSVGNSIIGHRTTSAGTKGVATVDGVASKLSSGGSLYVGEHGDGELTVSDGGTAESASATVVGREVGSSGLVEVTDTDSKLTSGAALVVGKVGSGTLKVLNGATVTSTSETSIGQNVDSAGSVTVNGSGSTLTSGANLYVGERSTGTLLVSDGGVVRTQDDNGTRSIYIGGGPSDEEANNRLGNGTATVTGSGSKLESDYGVYVARTGTGELTVDNDAEVTAKYIRVGYYGFDGDGDPANGQVWVKNGASVDATVDDGTGTWAGIAVGNRGGTGTLSIDSGGSVTSSSQIFIGRQDGSMGTVTVSGHGSKMEALSDDLYVGGFEDEERSSANGTYWRGYGTGSLTISDGGLVKNRDGFVGIYDSQHGTSQGSVTVTGIDSSSVKSHWQVTDDLYLGGDENSSGGNGTLNIEDGAKVTVGDDMRIWANGALNVKSGSITVGDQFVSSGTITGGGSITAGTVALTGGMLAPGNSPGQLDILSDLSLANTTFQVELGGLIQGSSYDFLNVQGNLSLSDSVLDIILVDSFTPTVGDTFTIVEWTGSLNGNFSNAASLNFSGVQYALDVFGDRFDLRVTDVSAVPLPPAVWLFGSGLAGLYGVSRRRRQAEV